MLRRRRATAYGYTLANSLMMISIASLANAINSKERSRNATASKRIEPVVISMTGMAGRGWANSIGAALPRRGADRLPSGRARSYGNPLARRAPQSTEGGLEARLRRPGLDAHAIAILDDLRAVAVKIDLVNSIVALRQLSTSVGINGGTNSNACTASQNCHSISIRLISFRNILDELNVRL